jgi:hypothetical protein
VIQPTIEQNEQRDLILQRPFIEEDAPSTLPQLGLRVQGLALAQDPADAQLQRQSAQVNDHHTLYNSDNQSLTNLSDNLRSEAHNTLTPQSSRRPDGSRRRPLVDFFTSRPTSNSFQSDTHRAVRATNLIHPEPIRPSFSPFTDGSPEPYPPLHLNGAPSSTETNKPNLLRSLDYGVNPFGFSDDEEQVDNNEQTNNDEPVDGEELVNNNEPVDGEEQVDGKE